MYFMKTSEYILFHGRCVFLPAIKLKQSKR